ncbi:hypothetical protein RRG08_053015, partial [Elysia crispata]
RRRVFGGLRVEQLARSRSVERFTPSRRLGLCMWKAGTMMAVGEMHPHTPRYNNGFMNSSPAPSFHHNAFGNGTISSSSSSNNGSSTTSAAPPPPATTATATAATKSTQCGRQHNKLLRYVPQLDGRAVDVNILLPVLSSYSRTQGLNILDPVFGGNSYNNRKTLVLAPICVNSTLLPCEPFLSAFVTSSKVTMGVGRGHQSLRSPSQEEGPESRSWLRSALLDAWALFLTLSSTGPQRTR